MPEWICCGKPVAEQLAAGRVYLTYAAYVAQCGEAGEAPFALHRFQWSMLQRGLALAPEDDLQDPYEIFPLACYEGHNRVVSRPTTNRRRSARKITAREELSNAEV